MPMHICQQYMICPSCIGNHDNYRKFIKIILTRCLWFSSIVTLYPSEVFTFMCCFREQIWIVTFMSFVAIRTIIKLCTIRQTVSNSSRVGLAEFWNFIYQINRSWLHERTKNYNLINNSDTSIDWTNINNNNNLGISFIS